MKECNDIYSAQSEDFLIKEYNPNGKYLKAFYYPFDNLKSTKEIVIQNQPTKYLQEMLKQHAVPKTWPALNSIITIGQKQIWISTIVNNLKVYQWWILNQKGKLLAQFTWPRNKPIEVIQDEHIYTRETDTTTRLQKIVRYQFTFEHN